MAIIIANARRSQASIEKAFPGAVIVNLTSKAKDDFVKFSPFYPHGGIPVPFSPGWTSESVEGIWQGLKVFSDFGVNTSKFKVASMSGLKRTERKFGKVLGHNRGVGGVDLLDYVQAKECIYLPAYRWVLENRLGDLMVRLADMAGVSVFLCARLGLLSVSGKSVCVQ